MRVGGFGLLEKTEDTAHCAFDLLGALRRDPAQQEVGPGFHEHADDRVGARERFKWLRLRAPGEDSEGRPWRLQGSESWTGPKGVSDRFTGIQIYSRFRVAPIF